MQRTTMITSVLLLFALCGATFGDDYRSSSKSEPVKITPREQAQLSELRQDLTRQVASIARFVAQDLGADPFRPPVKFTVTVDNSTSSAPTIEIEMDDLIVVGDGNGCVKDPPGISCECPCP